MNTIIMVNSIVMMDPRLFIYEDGRTERYQNDLLHCDDGPAIECPYYGKEWYENGHFIKADYSINDSKKIYYAIQYEEHPKYEVGKTYQHKNGIKFYKSLHECIERIYKSYDHDKYHSFEVNVNGIIDRDRGTGQLRTNSLTIVKRIR